MMDPQEANHSLTPCAPWAVYSGRCCSAGGQGLSRDLLPDLGHLSLGSPMPGDTGCYLGQSHVSNQDFQNGIMTTAAPVSDPHPHRCYPGCWRRVLLIKCDCSKLYLRRLMHQYIFVLNYSDLIVLDYICLWKLNTQKKKFNVTCQPTSDL